MTFNEFIPFDVLESNHMGEQRSQFQNPKFTTIPFQNCNIIPKMFEPSKKPNPLVVEDVHVYNLKKLKKKLTLMWITSFKMFGLWKCLGQSLFSMKFDWLRLWNVMFVLKLKRKTRFWWLSGIILQGPSMIEYAQKTILKKINFKNSIFSTLTLKKILKTYLNCILKS